MLDEEYLSASRQEKLEKQRELIRRKQKKKHAHQVLSLHMLSENFESSKREDRGRLTPKSNKKASGVDGSDGYATFAYDGPQSYDLGNPDELTHPEVQVIRITDSPLSVQSFHHHHRIGTPVESNSNERYSTVHGQGITRSSTQMSSLDQETLLLSASEDEADTSHPLPDIASGRSTLPSSRVSSPPNNPISETKSGHKPSPVVRTHTDDSPKRVPMNGRLMNWDMQELPDDCHSGPTHTSPVRLLCDRLQNLSNAQDSSQSSPDAIQLSVPHPGKRKERSKDQRPESAPAPSQRLSSHKLHSIQAPETDTLHASIPMQDTGGAQSSIIQVESFESPIRQRPRKQGNKSDQKNSDSIFHNASSATESCLSLLVSDTLDSFRTPAPKSAKQVIAPSSRKASCKSPPIIQLARTARILSTGKGTPSRKHRRAVEKPSTPSRPSYQPTFEVRRFPTGTVHNNSNPLSTGSLRSADQSNSDARLDPTENLEEFVLQPAPKGLTVRCRITRDKRGVDRGIFPTYYVHMEQEDRKYFLLAARRRKRSTTSNYIISCDATDLSRSAASFAGKLRSNFVGTQFVVYGGGKRANRRHDAPSAGLRSRASLRSTGSSCELTEDDDSQDDSKELAAIIYDTNVLGFKGPRKMTVLLPRLNENDQRIEFGGRYPNESLVESWKQKSLQSLLELHNKNPVWNEDTQSYVLNFYGRVTQASVKNFQIVDDANTNFVIMQFGRVAEDVFTMDYAYPMCALQAFGIALSSFDGKLACE